MGRVSEVVATCLVLESQWHTVFIFDAFPLGISDVIEQHAAAHDPATVVPVVDAIVKGVWHVVVVQAVVVLAFGRMGEMLYVGK